MTRRCAARARPARFATGPTAPFGRLLATLALVLVATPFVPVSAQPASARPPVVFGAGPAARLPACRAGAYLPAALLAACRGDAGSPSARPPTGRAGPPAADVAVDPMRCAAPAYPVPPADALRVADFGAIADDPLDDTEAIQRALDALREGQWLTFAPGVYRHRASLVVGRAGVTLWGEGATLQATNPRDQALRIVADRVSVFRFRLIAATVARGTLPAESRIAVYPHDERDVVRGVRLRGNRIEDDPAQPGYENASTAAAVFLHRADDFRIEDNRIARSLADGIHLTAGSRDGLVARNRVLQTGDDAIAAVSYRARAQHDVVSEADRVRDVLIVDNDVGGQYWGRGIAVVGGRRVAILGNRIADGAMAASIYVARESYWLTDGVTQVLVAGNVVVDNQVAPPAYNPRDTYTESARTAQGAIEVYAWLWADERGSDAVAARLGIDAVAICDNTIARVRTAGVRIGAGSDRPVAAVDHTGLAGTIANGVLRGLTVVGNRFADVASPVDIHPSSLAQVVCGDGRPPPGRGTCPQGGLPPPPSPR